jgi:hypothetical protein
MRAQHDSSPGPLSPQPIEDRSKAPHLVRRKAAVAKHAVQILGHDAESSTSGNRRLSEWSGTSSSSSTEEHPSQRANISQKKRTLVVYSGPTSLDPTIGKNGVYLKNFDYFIQHGIECHGLGGVDDDTTRPFQDNNIQYVIVLTAPVAEAYTAADGLITKKQAECQAAQTRSGINQEEPLITVLTRQDKCYDMESILTVLRTYNVPTLYDHMVYMNCGLAGPKFGSGSPPQWHHLNSWTELYTSLLSDKIQMVGHTINTHFNTVYSPHIQSFLFAVNTAVIDIWMQTGAIYECGVTNADFSDEILKMALVWRYEVGISRVLLERGYSIAAAFMHQNGRIGEPLVINANSTFGRDYTREDVVNSDVFTEDGLRRLTESTFEEQYGDRRKYAILPWDCYVFFKVSRLIPYDIQELMRYENLGPLQLVPNDASHSASFRWRFKAGFSLVGEGMRLVGISRNGSNESLRCHGRICQFEKATEGFGVVMIVMIVLWYFATLKFVERRLNLHRLSEKWHKWN